MIQQQLNNDVFNYLPQIAQRICEANEFEGNQMRCKTLEICNNALLTALDKQTKEQLKETEEYILNLFKLRKWV